MTYLNSHNIIWEMRGPRRKDSYLSQKSHRRDLEKVAGCCTGLKTQSDVSTELKLLPLLSMSSNETRMVQELIPAEEILTHDVPEGAPCQSATETTTCSRAPSTPCCPLVQTWFKIATSFPPFPPSWSKGGVPLDISNSSRHLCLDNEIPSWETQARLPCCHHTSRDSTDRPSATTGQCFVSLNTDRSSSS